LSDIEQALKDELKEALFKAYLFKTFGAENILIMETAHDPKLPLIKREMKNQFNQRCKFISEAEDLAEQKRIYKMTFGDSKFLRYAWLRLFHFKQADKSYKRSEQEKIDLQKVREYNETIELDLAKKRKKLYEKQAKQSEKKRKKQFVKETLEYQKKLAYQETEKEIVKEQNRREIRKSIKEWNKLIRKVFNE